MAVSCPGAGKIREPIVEGILYPADKDELAEKIMSLLEKAKLRDGGAFGIITPHAGIEYTGPLMAAAYKSASARDIDTAVILASVHRPADDKIILPESHFFNTPLGSLTVNKKLVEELLSCSTAAIRNDIPHLEEHSIEVQLPYIQLLFPDCEILPILMGSPKPGNVKALGNALQLILSDKYDRTLIVVTTNMSSYKNKLQAESEATLFLELVNNADWQGINEALLKKQITSCGAACVASILSFSSVVFRVEILDRLSSDQIKKDRENAIQYAAVSLFRER
jgi:AmmeMemoRadiSam system protein B